MAFVARNEEGIEQLKVRDPGVIAKKANFGKGFFGRLS